MKKNLGADAYAGQLFKSVLFVETKISDLRGDVLKKRQKNQKNGSNIPPILRSRLSSD